VRQPVLIINNLTKIYKNGIKANDRLSLEIYAGEIFGILGPNGAGKTTLVRQIMGLLQPTEGTITVFGKNIALYPDVIKTRMSYQPQKPFALWDLRVREALCLTGYLRGLEKEEARNEALTIIQDLDLSEYQNVLIYQLSGGLLRLLSFAIALVGHPELIILDEPTEELDVARRRIVWEKIKILNEQGTTFLLVTHNVIEAEQVLHRVAIMNQGKILAVGTPGELKRSVDKRIRFDLTLKSDLDETLIHMLNRIGEVSIVHPQRVLVFVDGKTVSEALDETFNVIRLENVDDFKISGYTLEDVLLRLGGDLLED